MRIFLVRHGETESNRKGLALGRADVPLNDLGRGQAERLAKTLAGEPLAAIYSSPLVRTMDTARAIAGDHTLDVQVEPDLVEMDIGEMDGLTFAEVRSRYPALLDSWSGVDGPETPMPGGERLVDVQQRAWAAIQAISERHPNETVCVVTHNFVILSLLATALRIDLAHFRRLRHAIAAISVLDFTPDRIRIISLNDTCHLEQGETNLNLG
jgi:broad specificity phosphatase PhoE